MKINNGNREPGSLEKGSPAGLYIHIPFCEKKCNYCNFLSLDSCNDEMKERYVQSLIKELRLYREKKIKIDTIFIGGGTPSLLNERQINDILEGSAYGFSMDRHMEITIETNPGTLTKSKLKTYQRAGINRLSMGVQSLDDRMLQALGRIHNKDCFLSNYAAAREIGFDHINIDLMFGIPGQTAEIWEETLEEAITLQPEHISFYSLQLEEGTLFYQKFKDGSMELISNEEERRLHHQAIRKLKEAGYHHYEISNCALPGYECRHNLKYWSFEDYYGVGLGAHSFVHQKKRWKNTDNPVFYFESLDAKTLPVDAKGCEQDSLEDRMGEYMFTGLRKLEGIDTRDFFRLFHREFYDVYRGCLDQLKAYQKEGYLILEGNKVVLTEKGIDRSNEIMSEFV